VIASVKVGRLPFAVTAIAGMPLGLLGQDLSIGVIGGDSLTTESAHRPCRMRGLLVGTSESGDGAMRG
jgi:hypothetical protein